MGKVIQEINNAINPFYKNGGNGNDDFSIYGVGAAYGNEGNDTLRAYAIYVKLDGGSGNDKIYAYSGGSDLYGGSGHDYIEAWGLSNRIQGGSGDDTIKAHAAHNDVSGGWGNDTIRAYGGYNKVHGDDGHDWLYVYGIANNAYGGGHDDYIEAAAAGNWLYGGWGNDTIRAYGGANIIDAGSGHDTIEAYGIANIITAGSGNLNFTGGGLGNVVYHGGHWGDLNAVAGGAVNVFVRRGNGRFNALLTAAGNVSVHVGNGDNQIFQMGGLNTHIHVGNGDAVVGMAGGLNVATLVGDGRFYGGFLGLGNVMTKVGTGDTYIAAIGAGNVLTHVDNSHNTSDTAAVLLGGGNILTKAGQGDLYGVMGGGFNVATHVGAGDVYMAQLGGANILTKVGEGLSVGAQFGAGNIFTHVGDGETLGVMGGNGNVLTKVGDGLTAGLMLGSFGNVYTHVGSGDSFALMAGAGGNLFTKVEPADINGSRPTADDYTVAAMFGGANAFTHVGGGKTGALMLSAGNLFTKVGDGDTVAAMAGQGNIATHVGNGATFAAMIGAPVIGLAPNVLTKVGDGATVGLMAANGNVFTHVGDGPTIGLAAGDANIITKVGEGDQITGAMGKANVITHVSLEGHDNGSYTMALGDANIITKVGDGDQVNLMAGKANVVTHVGDGDSINLAAGGQANVITKVGDGDTVTGVLNSQVNVVTHIGDGDDYQGIWGRANVVTKVGDGASVSALKGDANVVTAVGDGAQVGLLWGDGNVITKVGDGVSVNVLKGQANVNTKVGDGTSVAVMSGAGNANIQIGDGLSVFAARANNNISVKIGNGDYYGFAIANGKATALQNAKAFGQNLLQTGGGFLGSELISQVIWGAEATGGQTNAGGNIDALETPLAINPTLNLSEDDANIAVSVEQANLQVSEPGAHSSLNQNNIQQINNHQQSQDAEASRQAAKQSETVVQNGIQDSRDSIDSLFQAQDQALKQGEDGKDFLTGSADVIVGQLSSLDTYVYNQDPGSAFSNGDTVRAEYANGLLQGVNQTLSTVETDANNALQQSADPIREARLHIEQINQDASLRQSNAQQSQTDATDVANDANQQKWAAENRVAQARADAQGHTNAAHTHVNQVNQDANSAKLNESDQPNNRQPAAGSGLTTDVQASHNTYSFTDKSAAELDKTADALLTDDQANTLNVGLDLDNLAAYQMINPTHNGSGKNGGEESTEGGLTEEQIAALHGAEQANNNLGLNGNWGESGSITKWVETVHQLKSNNRLSFEEFELKLVNKDLDLVTKDKQKGDEIAKKKAEIEKNTNDIYNQGIEVFNNNEPNQIKYFSYLQTKQVKLKKELAKLEKEQVKLEAEIKTNEFYAELNAWLLSDSSLDRSNVVVETYQTIRNNVLGRIAIELFSNSEVPSKAINFIDKVKEIRNSNPRIEDIDAVNIALTEISSDFKLDVNQSNLLKAINSENLLLNSFADEFRATIENHFKLNPSESVETYLNYTKESLSAAIENAYLAVSYNNPNLGDANYSSHFGKGNGNISSSEVDGEKLKFGSNYVSISVTRKGQISEAGDAEKADLKVDKFNILEDGKKSPISIGRSGIKYSAYKWIGSLIESAQDQDKHSLRALKASLLKYKRVEASEYGNILNNDGNDEHRTGRDWWETIYTEVSKGQLKDSESPYLEGSSPRSINHILADSSIASLLHVLASKAKFGSDDQKKTEALQAANNLIDALSGKGHGLDNFDPNGTKAEQFATAAKNYFQDYLDGRGTESLRKAIHAISYAPGNIRWGDGSTNSTIGNHFDPIFEYDSDVKKIKLSTSSRIIYDAVNSISKVIDEDDFNFTKMALVLASDDNTNSILSSSKIQNISEETGHSFQVIIDDDGNRFIAVEVPVEVEEGDMDVEADNNKRKRLENIGFDESLYEENDSLLKRSNRSSSILPEETSGLEKTTKRFDYEKTLETTTKFGDELTIIKIHEPNGGEPVYRLQIDIGGDKSKRINVFSSENPVQADGTIKIPAWNTIVSHGEKVEGASYTSRLENHYLGEDDKYLNIGANDFRNVENLRTAETTAANSDNSVYLLTKYRGVDEGVDLNMRKNQEQILLTSLRDRQSKQKDSMGYVTVGKHASVTSQEAEAALGRLGAVRLINGYCRVLPNTPETTNNTYKVQVEPDALESHRADESKFANDIKRTVATVARARETTLEGIRLLSSETLIERGDSVKEKLFHKAFYSAPNSLKSTINSAHLLDTNGNIQLHVGDGEFNAGFWGNTNLGIKIGDGGLKTTAFGDNNVMIHIGDGDSAKSTMDVGGYRAFESAQVFIGERNVSFNSGESNDFIVMLDKSFPLAPFQSPFNGPSDIVGYLNNDIAGFSLAANAEEQIDPLTGDPIAVENDFYESQNYLWSVDNAKQIIQQISALDMNSAVEYDTLFDYGSEQDRSDRALKADAERKANAMFNQAMAGESPWTSAKNRNLKDQNFNITVAGQGSDIVIANGDNQFIFGDNVHSILDTTIASLFGVLSQDPGKNGMVSNPLAVSGGASAKAAFLNTLKNLGQDTFSRVMARTTAGLPDMSFGEAFGLDYTAAGQLVVTDPELGSAVDLTGYAQAGLQGMMGALSHFGNTNLGFYLESSRLVESLRTALNQESEEIAIANFRDSLVGQSADGTGQNSTVDNGAPASSTANNNGAEQPAASDGSASSAPGVPPMKASEVFGFGALKLPSIFDFDISSGFSSIPQMINDMAGLLDSFEGDIDTMQTQMFDFFSNSGYMQGDGDLLLSLGNNNFAWGGDGADIAGFMGLNNNFWGGRGNDMFYGLGENNQASGNAGDDTAVLLGINNIFLGGDGRDFGLAAGRNGNLAGGNGADTLYALGDNSWLTGGGGNDYLVAVGNYNGVNGGEGHDYAVMIGNLGAVDLGDGHDVVSVFGNKNTIKTGIGDDLLRLMGHQSELSAGDGNDFIWVESDARDNTAVAGDAGDDTFVLGGLNNRYFGGEGHDSFILSHNYQAATIGDISADDRLIFANVTSDQIWFTRQQNDLLINLDVANDQPLLNSAGDDLLGGAASALTLTDYFNGRQADIVVNPTAIADTGEAAYEALTQEALAQLIQIMSAYDVVGSSEAFLTNVTVDDQQNLVMAWNDTALHQGSAFVV
ncbi:MAG: hypothetical protein MJA27_08615 [Pseudanabaenales cyanobacterium]|nr:hypothetical protein [Pseudanabaenales cyanobacterium]